MAMRSFLMLWSLAALVLSAVVSAQDYPNNNVTSLEGTWSSGSGGVLTGQGPDSTFFNPLRRQFSIPRTSGRSYSFTNDGFFEMASFTYGSDRMFISLTAASTPSCFNATLVWQHGTYNLSGGSMVMTPFKGDGAVQVMGRCLNPQVKMDYYSEYVLPADHRVEKIANWTTFVETDAVFYPNNTGSVYGLQMYEGNGVPKAKMYLQFRPPRMMPTKSIFKQVIGAPS